MKLTIVILLAVVNLMVHADVTSDDNVAKGKREAPMAEPSTEYLPPRLEAPYATYQPILAGANAAPQTYYQPNAFAQSSLVTPAPAPAYEYSRYAGVIPLQTVENNDLGNGLHPGPPYSLPAGLTPGYSGANGGNQASSANSASAANTGNGGFGDTSQYGSFVKYGQNSQGNLASTYGSYNGAGQSLTVYGSNGYENPGNFEQYSTIKASHFGGTGQDNQFYTNSYGAQNKYPSSAALLSNQQQQQQQEPIYAAGVKGLGHYSQSGSVSSINAQTLKSSRPVAITPSHLTRKPPSFLADARNPNFRPSFLLGSSVLSSTPDYNQASLSSLGTTNQYIPPTSQIFPSNPQIIPSTQQYVPATQQIPEQYTAPQSFGSLPLTQREYLPPQGTPNFATSYQSPQQPSPSYGLPETIIYTKSSLFGEQYGPPQ